MKDWIVLVVNYTLSLIMWLIVGRMALSLFTRDRNNFMLSFFIRFTDPVYKLLGKIFPFTRRSAGSEGTYWETIGGLAPFLSLFLILILRVILIKFFGPKISQ